MTTSGAAGAIQPTRQINKKRKLSAINNTPANTSNPKNDSIPNASSSQPRRTKSTKTSALPPRPSIPHNLTTATSPLPDDQDGIKALKSMEDTEKYDVQIHSVISSSKMQKKVGSVLRHLQSTDQSKTRVTVLRARATDAGKLVSIAEIAKREVEKLDGGEGMWYQYILIGEELQERKRGNESVLVDETVLDRGADEDGEEDEEDDEDDFEVMKTRLERAIEGTPLIRGVPIMSLFLSRVSLGELKRRCGEQTNSAP